MRKFAIIVFSTLILSIFLTLNLPAKQRAIQVKARTVDGSTKELPLYSGYHALMVGCGDYTDYMIPDLPNVVKDINELAKVLKGIGFEVETLLNPKSDQIEEAFNQLIVSVGRERDKAILVYFAGHGETLIQADGTKLGYILPVDTPHPERDLLGFLSKAISMKRIDEVSRLIHSKHVLMVFDSCFSGALFAAVRDIPKYITEKTTKPVREYITAGTEDEKVPDTSIFKRVFIQGFQDRYADLNHDGYITGLELGMYLSDKVVQYSNGGQHPQVGKINHPALDKGDFVFALEAPSEPSTQISMEPPPPKEPSGMRDYDKLIQERKAIKNKWFQWQARMEDDFAQAERYNQSLELTPKERAEAWATFLSAYSEDNPYSSKDDELREKAVKRHRDIQYSDWIHKGGLSLSGSNIQELPKKEKKENLQRAIDAYSKAIKLDPKRADAYWHRSIAYQMIGNYKEAIIDLEKSIEIKPDSRCLDYMTLASLLSNTKQCKKAISVLQQAIELKIEPIDWLYRTMGTAYMDCMGLRDKTVAAYKKAIELTPYNSEGYYYLGRAYNKWGQHDKAIETYQDILKFVSANESVNILGLLGDAYAKQGKKLKAIEAYETILKIKASYPSDSDTALQRAVKQNAHKEIKTKLKKLKGETPKDADFLKEPEEPSLFEKYIKQTGKEGFTNSIGMKFLYIPPGTFMMGSPPDELYRVEDEKQHKVTITRPFFLQTAEVTQGQWKRVMGYNPSYFKDCGGDCPVENVSCKDIQKFMRKLNQTEGTNKYRLPTEAEWEYACRGGVNSMFFSFSFFGRCISTDQANYNGKSPMLACPKGEYRKRTVRVGSFPPNPWGLYDMHGNVWEWCQDWYGDYPTGYVTDPTGPMSGERRVLRGGSWADHATYLRSATRYWSSPDDRYNNIGFRVVRNY